MNTQTLTKPKLYHIKTIAKKNSQVIVEDILCEKHWNELKVRAFFQSDHEYEVKVSIIQTDEFECQDC